MTYQKLVRDRIPEIIKNKGGVAITRTLGDEEYKAELLKKLVEEASELLEAPGDMGERADIAEVLSAIDQAFGFDEHAVEAARRAKAEERGGFAQKIYLESVE